jgi:IstB-like ATP binding protein
VNSNKTFSAWAEIFGDPVAVAAMVDRLVHHAEVIVLRVERPWRATTFATEWPHVAEGPEAAAAAELLETVLAERWFEELMRWIDERADEPEEWQEAAAFGDSLVHLTAEELTELSRDVRSLVERFIERTVNRELRPPGSRPITFLHLAFPTPERPAAAPEPRAGSPER